ncbi:DUF2314 domain-containing protein [Dasania sp. GY-MA-18]|uniref:DUF2314 domain-containing protein n=1 Tax=Dasania phycosphaerae TaxID=2950436 RepID=A0A9J6RKJ6_9GAMM|nr:MULTISPECIES: DUF2314 domain-containing protein [Dasania]MCR8922800.1 DUF2314 domain-containing protein [Dasania sp. GY-MA-18]MCZ0865230.1 DUF2314 domain-containing protein [Dasania phycosphaerae]MCZ0868956.1 DUF2314 domain-containing protein [Dasania phycosphaerae]
MQLPTYEKDHYELDNGEEIHREYPDSFWIPDSEVRESLSAGDLVKLIFRMEEKKGSDDVSVERMWVEVTNKHESLYEGVLDNDPSGSNCVHCGQTVYFQPCHVIAVHDE